MPRSIRTKHLSGHIARPDDFTDHMAGVFAWPGIVEFDDILDEVYPMRASRKWPNRQLWAMKVCARRARGTVNAARAADRAGWEAARQAHFDTFGEWLPVEVPSAQVTDELYRRVAADADALQEMQARTMEVAVAQAKFYGCFDPNKPWDYTDPDESLTVIGDGTIIDEYSRIRLDPAGQLGRWGYRHTKATAPHRVRYQQMRRDPKAVPDHKGKEGINFVGFYTWTPYGTVGFGAVAELRGEIHGAQAFVDALRAETGDGFRFLDYDRVFTGWRRHRLMAEHGISAVNKENAASSVAHERARAYLERHAREIAATAGLNLDEATLEALMSTTARTLVEQEAPLPLGINLYATTDGYDAVNGKLYAYGSVTSDAPGHTCAPELWADDGALWVVEDGVKTGRCIPRRSTAERLADGTYAQHTDWHVPCPHGGFDHHSVWYPQRAQQDSRRRDRHQRVLDNIRVPSRRDPGFKAANQRNLSESVNQTAQTTTQHHGRASSPNGNVQTLDMQAVHHMVNAETHQRAVRAGAY